MFPASGRPRELAPRKRRATAAAIQSKSRLRALANTWTPDHPGDPSLSGLTRRSLDGAQSGFGKVQRSQRRYGYWKIRFPLIGVLRPHSACATRDQRQGAQRRRQWPRHCPPARESRWLRHGQSRGSQGHPSLRSGVHKRQLPAGSAAVLLAATAEPRYARRPNSADIVHLTEDLYSRSPTPCATSVRLRSIRDWTGPVAPASSSRTGLPLRRQPFVGFGQCLEALVLDQTDRHRPRDGSAGSGRG